MGATAARIVLEPNHTTRRLVNFAREPSSAADVDGHYPTIREAAGFGRKRMVMTSP